MLSPAPAMKSCLKMLTSCQLVLNILILLSPLANIVLQAFDCVLAIIYAGGDASKLDHCQKEYNAAVHAGMTCEKAEEQMRKNSDAAVRYNESKKRRRTANK